MTNEHDQNYIGDLALKKEMITGEQLEECRKLKASSSPPKSLARVLLEKGYLSDNQLGELLAEYKLTVGERFPEDSDPGSIGFGEAVVQQGLVKNVDVWDAIEEQARRKIDGSEERLGQILIEKGTLAISQAQAILESQGKMILKCAECGHQYNVREFNQNKEYTCLNCGGPLSQPEAVSSLKVHGTAVDSQTVKQHMDDKFSGREIGGCDILEKLGEGGMGAVYRARHITLNKIVAVKIMSSALMGEIHRKRFLREARAAAQLEHTNIIQVHDTGVAEGFNFIVMQFIDGVSLQKKIAQEGRIPQKEAMRIIRDAADALGFAHKRHMIHRDIKPDNIMVTTDNVVKVADFGLVKSTEIEKDLTGMSQSMLMGTPHYMSPEQFEGKIIDHRTDIYSLGVTLYYMLTGQRPYDGTTPYQIMQGHLQQEFVDPSNLSEDIYPAVSSLVKKMMAREREQRYQNCDDLVSDVNKVLGGFEDGTIATEDFIIIDDDLPETIQTKAPEVVGKAATARGEKPAAPAKKSALVIVVPLIILVAVAGVVAYVLLSGPKEKENGDGPVVVVPPEEPGKIDPKAQAAFNLTEEEADRLAKTNLFFDAWSKWDGFVPKWGEDPWKPRVDNERKVLIEMAITKISQLLAGGQLGKEEMQKLRDQVNKLNDVSQNKELTTVADTVGEKLKGMEASEETAKRLLKEFEEADRRAQELKADGQLAEARKIYDPKYTGSEVDQIKTKALGRVAEIDEALAALQTQRDNFDKADEVAQELRGQHLYEQAKAKYAPFTKQGILEELQTKANIRIAEIEEDMRNFEKEQFDAALSSARDMFKNKDFAGARREINRYMNHSVEEFVKSARELETEIKTHEKFWGQMDTVDALYDQGNYENALEIASRYETSENSEFAEVSAGKITKIRRKRYQDKQLIFIDGGEIQIGSKDPRDRNPSKKVVIKHLYMDQNEVTNAQYEQFIKDTGHRAPLHWKGSRPPRGKGNHPVTWVSYKDAIEFCKWRSDREGTTYRLPTESEWEYAASYEPETGTKSIYPWGDKFDSSKANLTGNKTAPVGDNAGDVSPLGVSDMAGNVAEWTSSDDGKTYVVRGGSMSDKGEPQTARVSFRHQTGSNTKGAGIGFRCVREK